MDFLTLAECHNLNSDYLAVSFSDDAGMSRFLFIFLFLALAGFRLFAQEIVPNPGRPFDLRKVKRLESGPAGHVYALDDENRLALIRFDSLTEADSLKISASIVKLIDFNSWLGNAKTQVHVEFSSSSADGKNLALAISTRKVKTIAPDGSKELATALTQICLFDLPSETISFRHSYRSDARFSSGFFGETLRFSDFKGGEERIFAFDGDSKAKRIFRRISVKGATEFGFSHLGRHIAASTEGFSKGDFYSVIDGINNLIFQLGSEAVVLEKDGQISQKVGIRDSSDLEIFRFRDFHIMAIHPQEAYFLINPRSARAETLPRLSGKINHQMCLMNGHVLVGLNRGVFTLCNISTGKIVRSAAVNLPAAPGKIPPTMANGNPTGSFALVYSESGKILWLDPAKRSFKFDSFHQVDSAGLAFPVNESPKFRIRTTRFSGTVDSVRSSKEGEFSPGVFMNGKRIGSFYGRSYRDFINLDISPSQNFICLNYKQPKLIVMNAEGNRIWETDNEFPLKALKVDQSGKSIRTWSDKGIVDFWNAKTGQKYLSLLFDTSSQDWIMWTPSGYYDCSASGEKLAAWLIPSEPDKNPRLYPFSSFSKYFRNPAVLDSVIQNYTEPKSISLIGPAAKKLILSNLPPKIDLEFPEPEQQFSSSKMVLQFSMEPGSKPVQKIRIFVDGNPLSEFVPKGNDGEISLELPQRDCLLELYPESAAGIGEKVLRNLRWIPAKLNSGK